TITTTGLSPLDLVISGVISNSGAGAATQPLVKMGAGGLSLTNVANTFTGGISVNEGSLIVGTGATVTAGVVVSSALGIGTVTMGNGAKLVGVGTTIYNPVI